MTLEDAGGLISRALKRETTSRLLRARSEEPTTNLPVQPRAEQAGGCGIARPAQPDRPGNRTFAVKGVDCEGPQIGAEVPIVRKIAGGNILAAAVVDRPD